MVEKRDLREQWVVCDICGNLAKLAEIKKMQVKVADRFILLFICPVCWSREQTGSSKYVKKAPKKLEHTPPIHRGATLQLIGTLDNIKKTLSKPFKVALKKSPAGSIPSIRADVIVKLVHAIEVVNSLAEKAPEQVEKGATGGTKERYFRVLGYLAQVLDGILKNKAVSEISELLDQAKGELKDELGGEAKTA